MIFFVRAFSVFFFLSAFFIVQAIGQPSIQWQKTLGGNSDDIAYAVQNTTDGGYIVAGYTRSNNSGDVGSNKGGFDLWVAKLKSNSDLDWQKTLGGSAAEIANSVQQTTDGGYIIAGYTSSNNSGDVGANNGTTDFWVVKLKSNGDMDWQKTLGGNNDEIAYAVQQTTDGGYIVAGYTFSNNSGDVGSSYGIHDFWVVKLKSNGDMDWQKTLGGSNTDIAYAIQQTTDGGYIVAGYTASNQSGNVGPNKGNQDFWVVKLTSSGDLDWQKTLGGTNSDIANAVQQTVDGGYIVAGFTMSNNSGDVGPNMGNRDFWVVKLKSNGDLDWQKTLGGSNDEAAQAVQQTADGGYIIAGRTASNTNGGTNNESNDFWVVKIKSDGDLDWQKTLGGSSAEIAYSVQQTTDGGYIVAGQTNSNNSGDVGASNGGADFWVVKLSETALPVNWLSMSAVTKSNIMQVNWETASETNNSHFEIEASADGKLFTQIGSPVATKAPDGNSDTKLEYSFTYTTSSNMLAAGLAAICLSLLLSRRKNKWLCTIAMAAAISLSALSCAKAVQDVGTYNDKLFIRIAQVDKDGTKQYSKIVKVVRE